MYYVKWADIEDKESKYGGTERYETLEEVQDALKALVEKYTSIRIEIKGM